MSDRSVNRREALQLIGGGLTLVGGTTVGISQSAAASDRTSGSSESIESLFELETGRTAEAVATTADDTVIYLGMDRLTALDGASGDERWSRTIELPDVRITRGSLGGATLNSRNTIATAGSVVIVYSTSLIVETITAYDTDTGDERWQVSFDGRLRTVEPTDTAVLVADGSDTLTVIDAETGDIEWAASEASLTLGRTTQLAAVGDRVVVSSRDPQAVVAFERDTGEMAWEEPFETELSVRFRVTADPATVYAVPDERSPPDDESVTLKRIDGSTGTVEWTTVFDSLIEAESYGHFRAVDETVLLMTEIEDERAVTLSAIDASSSERRWEMTIDDNRARLTATPEAAVVLAGSLDATVSIIDLQTGETETTIDAPGRSGSGGGDPLVEHAGTVYHQRDAPPGSRIFAVDLEAGELAYDRGVMGRLNERILQDFAARDTTQEFAAEALLVPAREETLTAVEPDEETRWEHDTGGYVVDAARGETADTTVVYTEGGTISAVDESTGDIEWTTRQTGVSDVGFGGVAPGVTVAGDDVYAASTVPRARQAGRLGAYDLTTGETRWDIELDEMPINVRVTEQRVLAAMGSFDVKVTAIDRASGDQNWEVALEETVDDIEHMYEPVDDRVTVLGPQDDSLALVEIDLDEQTVADTTEIDAIEPFVTMTARAGDRVVLAGVSATGSETILIGIDTTTGEVVWEQLIEDNAPGTIELETISSDIVHGTLAMIVNPSDDPTELRLLDIETGDTIGSRPDRELGRGSTPLLVAGGDHFLLLDEDTVQIVPASDRLDADTTFASFDISPPVVTLIAADTHFYVTQGLDPFLGAVVPGAEQPSQAELQLRLDVPTTVSRDQSFSVGVTVDETAGFIAEDIEITLAVGSDDGDTASYEETITIATLDAATERLVTFGEDEDTPEVGPLAEGDYEATVEVDADNAETVRTTESFTVSDEPDEEPTAEDFITRDEAGNVEDVEVFDAIDDFRSDRLESGELFDVISAFREA